MYARPLAQGMVTYDEKTCWETWLAGLEFSAPIFVAPDVLDALRCRRWNSQKSDLSLALQITLAGRGKASRVHFNTTLPTSPCRRANKICLCSSGADCCRDASNNTVLQLQLISRPTDQSLRSLSRTSCPLLQPTRCRSPHL
jgi:hypothetical protein